MTRLPLTLVALPGLNGTQGLFKPLLEAAPTGWRVLALDYPTHQKNSYESLTQHILHRLKQIEGSFILLGESFSGPLALLIAQHEPEGLRGLILCASFINAPHLKLGKYLPWAMGFALVRFLLKQLHLLPKNHHFQLLELLSPELQKVSISVLTDRIQSVFSVDTTAALIECPVPIIYFRGMKDLLVPKRNLQQIHHLRPDIQIAEFDTSHFLLQEAPKQAWIAIKEFNSSLNLKINIMKNF